METKSSRSKALKSLGLAVSDYQIRDQSIHMPISLRVKEIDGKKTVVGECFNGDSCEVGITPKLYTDRDVFAQKVSDAVKAMWDKL